MKKIIIALTFGAVVGGGITAIAAPKHENIVDAHDAIVQALGKIDDAQKANEFDLGGHAAKAKDLLHQAEPELKQAADIATAADNSK
jgi:hypothetical protein